MDSFVLPFERGSREASLEWLPLAARRALDVAGAKLSLAAWQALPLDTRRALATEGARPIVDAKAVHELVRDAAPPLTPIDALDESTLDPCDGEAARLLGLDRPLATLWPTLSRLQRFALRHLGKRGDAERLAVAYDALVSTPSRLTHLDDQGQAHMVDVGDKNVTHRRAVARARVRMAPDTARIVVEQAHAKGDVLATARIAGIMAAKRTSELIPLCHPIALSRVAVDIAVDADTGTITVEATAETRDRTGVEMEAMVAASVAALTIYDMLKGVQRDIVIERVVLIEKAGGRSGLYRRADEP